MVSFYLVEQYISADPSPKAQKAVNLGIHIACGALLYFLAFTVLSAGTSFANLSPTFGALLVSGFWLLNPLHVSTVLYTIQRMAQLSTLFVLAGLICYARFRVRTIRDVLDASSIIQTMAWILFFFVLGVLSKENAILLPFLIATLEVCIFRYRTGQGISKGLRMFGLFTLFGLPLSFLGTYVLFPEWWEFAYAGRDFSFSERLYTQARVLWLYLYLFFAPLSSDFGLFHDDLLLSRSLISPFSTLVASGCWIFALSFSVSIFRYTPYLFFALIFYLVAHSLESGPVPLELTFEHRNYLPTVGASFLLLPLALLVSRLKLKMVRRVLVVSIGISLTLGLSLRASTWGSEDLLSKSLVISHPGSARSRHYRANVSLAHAAAQKDSGAPPEQFVPFIQMAHVEVRRAHASDLTDAASLATLAVFETKYFSNRGNANKRLQGLITVLEARRLGPTEIRSCELIFNCVSDGRCQFHSALLAQLETVLLENSANRVAAVEVIYNYRKAAGDDPLRILKFLQLQLELNPAGHGLHRLMLAASQEVGDEVQFAESLLQYYREDSLRRSIPHIKEVL